MRLQIGYYPRKLDFQTSSGIKVATLPDLDEHVHAVSIADNVQHGWYFENPPQRVFALPKTHSIEHPNPINDEHLRFLIWCLGFLLGMRLTDTEAGFVDATPIETGKLAHDIVWIGNEGRQKALNCADLFWRKYASTPRIAKALTGVIHCMFLAHNRAAFMFERFIYLYTALDGCHFVFRKKNGTAGQGGSHRSRVKELCDSFGMPVPTWADPASPSNIADFRNDTLHEGLFFDEPLGFKVYPGQNPGTASPIPFQMKLFVSRLLFALLEIPATAYIRSPVNRRQMVGVKVPS